MTASGPVPQGAPSGQRPILAWQPRFTVRLRLTLIYAAFLVVSAIMVAVLIYLVMRYVPDYPLTSAQDPSLPVPSRGEILRALVSMSGGAIGLIAVVGLAGGWFLAGRVLRPLQRINAAARLAASGDLDHRLGLGGRSDEFKDLADTFDALLDRLQDQLLEQRRFAANASHELRTPQAVTKMMLEVAMADPANQDYAELTRRLHHTNERGIDIVTTLLMLADLDNQPLRTQPVDLAAAAASAIDDLLPEASARGVTLRPELEPCTVDADPVLVGHVVGNLLQNAIRHNLPYGGWVVVRTVAGREGASGQVVVSNTGEVVPHDAVAHFVEPFVRGRGRLAAGSSGSGGHGLGLALVARAVQVHGGELELVARPEGGLTVTARLPSA